MLLIVVKTLIDIYRCKVSQLPDNVLMTLLKESVKSGPPWTDLRYCLKNDSSKDKCFNDIERACRNSNVITSKVLRIDTSVVKILLQSIPSLQILFLVRDPRAIVNSRIQTDWFPIYNTSKEKIRSDIESLCVKMNKDFEGFVSIKGSYPTRVHFIKYETLMSNVSVVEDMYRRLDIDLNTTNGSFVNKVIHNNIKENIASKWKESLLKEHMLYIESQCKAALAYNQNYKLLKGWL